MANIVIDIATEFTGKKGFKQAETATDKLSKNVKKMAGALGLAFSGQAILAYGKAAVKAAAEDEKAQKQLALALKNVGLGRDAATSEAYIQKLQSEFGILDDKLRPAYQTLAVATRDSAEAQRLLNLALNISASTGKDLASTSSALSKAFLGNNTALSKLGVGISKADLKAGKFEDIIANLETTFAGAATQSANTFQGSIDKLSVASANASEIIGTGLIDALKGLSDQNSVDNLAVQMESVATYVADTIRGLGVMIGYIKTASEAISKIPGLNKIMQLVLRTNPLYEPIVLLNKLGKEAAAIAAQTGDTAQALAHLAELEAKYSTNALGVKRKLTAEELKALAAARKKLEAKKLEAAIDKANLALNKGEDIFDLEKIQVAAALTNQAEQLGKVTSSAQVLQIANDTARLRVKESISALEDAIALKDEAAIIKATAKLNEDLKILGALTKQDLKLKDIQSILETLKPKDLINLNNLDAALAKIQEMLALLKLANTAATAKVPTSGTLGSGIPAGDYIEPISKEIAAKGSIGAILEYAEAATARANAFADLQDMQNAADELALNEYIKKLGMSSSASTIDTSLSEPIATAAAIQSGNRYAAQAAAQYAITINAGIGSDPESIARAVEDILNQSSYRGTSVNRGSGNYVL
jgi:hypothetical protein